MIPVKAPPNCRRRAGTVPPTITTAAKPCLDPPIRQVNVATGSCITSAPGAVSGGETGFRGAYPPVADLGSVSTADTRCGESAVSRVIKIRTSLGNVHKPVDILLKMCEYSVPLCTRNY